MAMNGEEWLIMINRGIIMDNYRTILISSKEVYEIGYTRNGIIKLAICGKSTN